MEFPEKLLQKLRDRKEANTYRELRISKLPVDFCSNDYLGLARSPVLRSAVEAELQQYRELPSGAGGSRLLSGNYELTEQLETMLASFHKAEAALLFNSGYAANAGFFSSVPQRSDTILYDESIHASIKDGIRLSFAKAFSFRHNDVNDLEAKLKRTSGNVYVAVEALYSMDGDLAPLAEMADVCSQFGAYLVVDEAHSNGIYGSGGEGFVSALKLEEQVFARILTFGKALGTHGAIVAGSQNLKDYLVNFSRPFIYTTALPLHTIITIKNAYTLLPELSSERARLKALSVYLQKKLTGKDVFSENEVSPIHAIGGFAPETLRLLAQNLQSAGFDVRPIFSPTVPEGKECLRLIIHAFNTEEEIDRMAEIISQVQ